MEVQPTNSIAAETQQKEEQAGKTRSKHRSRDPRPSEGSHLVYDGPGAVPMGMPVRPTPLPRVLAQKARTALRLLTDAMPHRAKQIAVLFDPRRSELTGLMGDRARQTFAREQVEVSKPAVSRQGHCASSLQHAGLACTLPKTCIRSSCLDTALSPSAGKLRLSAASTCGDLCCTFSPVDAGRLTRCAARVLHQGTGSTPACFRSIVRWTRGDSYRSGYSIWIRAL